VENWIPSQLDALAHPHVRAFVTHGGSNGFHESMYFGKPVLVVPAWFDCYAIGRRAVDSGVGLAVRDPNDITSGELVGMLNRLLTDDTFTERAEYWSARVRAAGGTTRAADLVLSMGTRPTSEAWRHLCRVAPYSYPDYLAGRARARGRGPR